MERTYSGDHLLKSTGDAASAGADISDAIKAVETVPRRTAPPSVILVIGILQVSLPCRSAPRRAALARRPRTGRSMYPFELFVRFQIVDCLSTRQIVHCLSKPCVISMKMYISGGEPALAETSDFRAEPPAGIDPIGASSEGASLYEQIREDIIEGRLAANERL